MKIETQNYGRVVVVDLQGEFVEEYADRFKETASTLISSDQIGIVIDMSQVSFIDSKALELLCWLRDECLDQQCQLKLAALDKNCSKILEITRLDSDFDVYDELAQAVKSYA